jgi:hypothetical protein
MLRVAVSAQAGRGTLRREITIKNHLGVQEKELFEGKDKVNM